MARVLLIEASPFDPATGAVVPVRIAGGGSRAYTHRGHRDWLAGLVTEPLFTTLLGFDENGWTGGALPQTGAVAIAPARRETLTMLAGLVWTGATIELRSGDDAETDPAWSLDLKGTAAGLTIKAGVVSLTISDFSGDLAKPLAPDTFAGTDGLEGGSDAVGRVKRRSWGRVWNVEGRLLDKANNIYEFGDPTRGLLALDAVKDRGREGDLTAVAWAGSAAATFAALQAADAPEGGAAIAPSIACAKWWTQPAGPLTADLRGETAGGYVETVAEIAARIAAAHSTITIAELAASAAARPDPAGLHCDNASETAGQALDRLLLGASMIWAMQPEGTMALYPVTFDDPVETVTFVDVGREAAYTPVTSIKLGYARNQRKQTDGEISAAVLAGDVEGLGPLATADEVDWSTQVGGDGKPEDGATVGAPAGTNVGDVPAEDVAGAVTDADGEIIKIADVKAEVAAAQGQIDDLIETYGDTASAAASASAAESAATTAQGYRDTAQTAATNADQAKTDAAAAETAAEDARDQARAAATAADGSADTAAGSAATASNKADAAAGSAEAAEGSATTATTKAGEASVSAGQAAQSKTDAAGSASQAASSATVAANAAGTAQNIQKLIPRSDFNNGASYWVYGYQQTKAQLPTATSITDAFTDATLEPVDGIGQVLQVDGIYRTMSERSTHPFIEGQKVRIRVKTRMTSDQIAQPHSQYLWITANDATGAWASYSSIGTWSGLTVADGWVVRELVFEPFTKLANLDDATEWRLMVGLNGFTTLSTAGAVQQIASIEIDDVTQSEAAADSAAAAASSASTAAAKADDAGESASSAQDSATTATTKAGEANAYAGQAASSASDTEGYKNTASTQATNAANSATLAGQKADAASGSASTAQTQAGIASTAASAAQASQVSANLSAAKLFPGTFDGDYFGDGGGIGSPASLSPISAAKIVSTQYGPAYQCNVGEQAYVPTRGVVPYQPGRKIRLHGRIWGSKKGTSGLDPLAAVYVRVLDSNYALVTSALPTPYFPAVVGPLTPFDFIYTIPTFAGAPAWLRFGMVFNRNADSSAMAGAQTRLLDFYVEDVTDSEAAKASAAAAASSESSAATSETAAGESASSAHADATTATTKAGEANTYAGQASASADAAGASASQASISESTAADHASDAADSADDAASSASTATGQASIASAQASAAQSSAALAASIGQGSLVKNPTFADWPDPNSAPTGWLLGNGQASLVRATGDTSPYSARLNANTVGLNSVWLRSSVGNATTQTVGVGDYLVVEADVVLNSGGFTAGGVALAIANNSGQVVQNIYMPFVTTPDITGVIPGLTYGKPYRYRVLLPQVTASDAFYFLVYAATQLSSLGSIAGRDNHYQWSRCAVRPATAQEIASRQATSDISALSASVSTNANAIAALDAGKASASSVTALQAEVGDNAAAITENTGAIADAAGATAYFERIVEASGDNPAIFQLLAGKNGSAIVLGGDRVMIVNTISGEAVTVASFEDGQARLNDALVRNLHVAPRSNSDIYLPVQLKPLVFLAGNGEVVQYQGGASFGAAPDRITVDASSLPALDSGEAYDVRAVGITDTQFTAKITKTVPATATVVNTPAGAASGGEPQWVCSKSGDDAYDGRYSFSVVATIPYIGRVQTSPDEAHPVWKYQYQGSLTLHAYYSGGWHQIGSMTLTRAFSTMQGGSVSASGAQLATSDGAGIILFGVSPAALTTVSSFPGVTYSVRSASGETAVAGHLPFTVYPPPPDS